MPVETLRIGERPAIAVDESGCDELLLFLHGIGGNRTNWSDQLGVFSERFRAVAWDARGYGLSDDYEGPVSFDVFADDVARVLDHYRADKAHICGLSLGGRIAQRFYARHAGRVASLVLADSRPDTGDTRTPAERDAFYAARAKPLLEGRAPADIAPGLARSLAAPDASEGAVQRLVESISGLRPESYLKTIRANLDDDYAGDPSAIRVPTLVVVGEHDTLTPPSLSHQLAETIPGAKLAIIAGAGHLTNIERPEAFNEVVLDFLSGVARIG